ncbi:MAG: hypothetical protein HQL65_11460 [Magnetococcales bacterium]|nr:hypothetical protein [Magnetococcales bacterium]
MQWVDGVSWPILLVIALMLGMAPVHPEPHLVEKLRMLSLGTLHKPIDIFDLIMHASPLLVIGIKLWRMHAHQKGAAT